MAGLELVLLLLAVAGALRVVAGRLAVPYPVLLVVGGLLLALVPGLPRITLEPDALFLIFVPPLLYWGARSLSFRDFRRALGPITRLAILMVLVSTAAVAVVARAVDPTFTWAAAIALGAIVSPPDPVAVLSIVRALSAPREVESILEGEGLLNDATALVAYRIAVAAAVTGMFSPWRAGVQFVVGGGGGVVVGIAVALAVLHVHRLLGQAPVVQSLVSLLTPFAAYLPAELLGTSGVLAVVATGMYVGRHALGFSDPAIRLQNEALWTVVTFLLESLIFIFIGLELPFVTRAMAHATLGRLLREAALVSACVVLVRLAWMVPSTYIGRAVGRWARGSHEPLPSWRVVLFVGWAGMRGGDSLVLALALPLATAAGAPFPARERIIFLTFAVILVTLVVQGTSLTPLLKWLRLPTERQAEDEEAHARVLAAEAAVRALDDPAVADGAHPEVIRYLRRRHQQRARRWAARESRQLRGRSHDFAQPHAVAAPSHEAGALDEQRAAEYRLLRARMIREELATVTALRDRGVIGDDVLRRIQRDLDLEAILLGTSEPVVEPPSEVASAIDRSDGGAATGAAIGTRSASSGETRPEVQ
ncbi:MAG TPA: Na+/H+ antiporter [Gemmatimonadaceae bacterium]|nr:Na+/H+ antiporter [Gemmatimonadaceae bacterium]